MNEIVNKFLLEEINLCLKCIEDNQDLYTFINSACGKRNF